MEDNGDKVKELIEAIKTINEFKKMQDAYIAELEKQNEELRQKLAGVEEELDKINRNKSNVKDIEEIYKKFFDKNNNKNPYINPQPEYPASPWRVSPNTNPWTYPGNGTVWCNSSSASENTFIKANSDYEKNIVRTYNKIIDEYIKPNDSFEIEDG